MNELINFIISIIIAFFGIDPSIIAEPAPEPEPAYVECGVCGAHVTEWWNVRNMDDTDWVDVCELCYLRIAADDYYWPWDERPDVCAECGNYIEGFTFGTSEGTFCADCYEG